MTRRERPLRRRCTTGACATAAAKAYTALVRSDFPDPVGITLPRGGRSTFAPAAAEGIALGDRIAEAAQLTATQLTAVRLLAGSAVVVDLAIFDREQNLVGCAPFKRRSHSAHSCGSGNSAFRHCGRSEAIQPAPLIMDCVVAALLALTQKLFAGTCSELHGQSAHPAPPRNRRR